jgi:tetratricopeptide (TPR) repeat protein
MTDIWIDRLSEYLDDELTPAERAALEAHLGSCRDCTTALGELRQVIARAATLTPRPPANDLWPGIEPRLERRGRIAPFAARSQRRFSFTMPQLVAAGLALMVMSGGGVWVLQHGGRATSMPPVVATNELPPAVVPAALTDPRYDEAIADLERALEEGRSQLDPETVKILEANLGAIDTAIDESRRALEADPANAYLNSHLADARQRKLALLRRATSLVQPKG